MNGGLVQSHLRLAGRLDERFFSLLSAVQATGSISRAARTAGFSYKGAWLLLEAAGNLAQAPLLHTCAGGAGGGGTQLTAAAQQLLAAWAALHQQHLAFVREQEAQLSRWPALQGLLRRMSMQTSARNQFVGQVATLTLGPVSALLTLALQGGGEITATLTTASAKRLKLKKGKEALALVKASAVVLVARESAGAGWQLAADNQLPGTVSRIERGAVSSLVVLTLPGGAAITATVTQEGVQALALKVGSAATAVFAASAVLVAAMP